MAQAIKSKYLFKLPAYSDQQSKSSSNKFTMRNRAMCATFGICEAATCKLQSINQSIGSNTFSVILSLTVTAFLNILSLTACVCGQKS